VLGLAANGFHTNGYTLLRRVLFDRLRLQVDDEYPDTGRTVGDELLRVHRSYLHGLLPLIRAGQIHALAHITGGGILENLERVVPSGLQAEIRKDAWELPPEFVTIMKQGPVERAEMFATFNMGIGMIVVVDPALAESVSSSLDGANHTVFEIGRIQKGNPLVVLV
jgi:phosphoribosylformylglycinamidine cyclo-ligase